MQKKIVALVMMLVMAMSLAACGSGNKAGAPDASSEPSAEVQDNNDTTSKSDFSAGMVTDTGGVNDKSFNQSAWEGLQNFSEKTGAEVSYLESTQEAEYVPNLDKLVDEGKDLVWGIGFAMAGALTEAAEMNPDVNYAIVDNAYEEVPENVTCVVFSAQDPSFMVGYIAGLTTKTDSVGFVGGMTSNIIDQFEYGYRAGVDLSLIHI